MDLKAIRAAVAVLVLVAVAWATAQRLDLGGDASPPPVTGAASAPPSAGGDGSAAGGSARDLLATLRVKGRGPLTGYDRNEFGPAWSDTDHNGCDTRNDVLRRDLDDVVVKPGTHGCVVLQGTLPDPYSGRDVRFLRGQTTSARVQIDHVVALADAWQKGARGWSTARRLAFANDPLNLLAVDGRLNQGKGAGDAATWLPPNKNYRCAYAARQIAVKAAYGVWVTSAERAALAAVLSRCPGQQAPSRTRSAGAEG